MSAVAETSHAQVNERDSGIYSCILVDELGNRLGPGDFQQLTLTLYDYDTGTILNTRDNQDVKNANSGTLDANGNFKWTWGPGDMEIIDDTKSIERHVALFYCLWNGSSREKRHEVHFDVVNLQRTP